jgi:hypothetical protein
MGRANYEFREQVGAEQKLNPIWRGVGFIILVLLTVGGFWLAGYLLELNWQRQFLPFSVPQDFMLTLGYGLPKVPGKLLLQLGATVIVDLVGYTLLVIAYSVLNPLRPGKTDAAQPRGRKRRSMVR